MESLAPIILGFNAVNRPSQALQNNPLTRTELQATAMEPPKKRRKKQKDSHLPSPSKSIKGKTSTSLSNAAIPVLSETTLSNLNAFCDRALPTPASNSVYTDEDLENLPPISSSTKRAIEKNSFIRTKAEDFLSSDLWKDQEPLPNYPWIYASVGELVSPPNHEGPMESRSFADSLPTDNQKSTESEDDIKIDEAELEKLFDEIVNSNADNFVLCPSQEELVEQTTITSGPKHGILTDDEGEYDFPTDEDILKTLYEVTSVENSRMKPPDALTTSLVGNMKSLSVGKDIPKEIGTAIVVSSQSFPGNSAISEGEHRISDIAVGEVPGATPTEHSLGSLLEKLDSSAGSIRSRFIRPPHPRALETPGPIPGLSPEKRILTCFRIGEAINATTTAQRQGFKVIIELYARVLHSIRAGPVQTFRIVDLWSCPDRLGLILDGRWIGWETADLWEKDGRVFWEDRFRDIDYDEHDLEQRYARKCRLIGSLQKKTSGGWLVNILSLWEAGWDDVGFAKQVFCEPGREPVA